MFCVLCNFFLLNLLLRRCSEEGKKGSEYKGKSVMFVFLILLYFILRINLSLHASSCVNCFSVTYSYKDLNLNLPNSFYHLSQAFRVVLVVLTYLIFLKRGFKFYYGYGGPKK